MYNRNRNHDALTDDQIRRFAPAVFAGHEHESRSDKYAYVPTIQVVDALRGEGFQPFNVQQANVRDASRRGFQKHIVRLRRPNQPAIRAGDHLHELVLINSHDGSSSFQLFAGIFRLVCANGLIIGNRECETRVRHEGNVIDNVIEGAYEVVSHADRNEQAAREFSGRALTDRERTAYAKAAIELRFDRRSDGTFPVQPNKLLQPRRYEDQGTDAWTTYNVVQENIIRGGIRQAPVQGENGRLKHTNRRTRAVRGIDQDVRLNRALWTLTEALAENAEEVAA